MPIQLRQVPPDGSYAATIYEVVNKFGKGSIIYRMRLDNGYEQVKAYNLNNPASLDVCVDDAGRLGYRPPITLEEAIEDIEKRVPARVNVYLKDGQINKIQGWRSDSPESLVKPEAIETPPDLLGYMLEKGKMKLPIRLNGRIVRPFQYKDLIFIECEENGEPKDPRGKNWGLKACENFPAEFGLTFEQAWTRRDLRYRYNNNKGWAEWEKSE